MLSTLITSKTRVAVLTWFITHPGERFHYNQLLTIIKASSRSIQNELQKLESSGLLVSKKEANVRFYWINQDHFLYPEIKSIIFKTAGLADLIKESIKKLGNVEIAFIYGSIAKNTEDSKSDIDLMVIGNPDYDKLSDIINEAENKLSREINFTVIEPEEWRKKLKEKDFVYTVNKGKKIFLIGSENDLRKIA